MTTEFTPKGRVQSLDRVVQILQCLAQCGAEMGVSEIANSVGLSKSTVHRLLSALEAHDFVRHAAGGKYRLGIRLFELGLRAVDEDGLLSCARPRLTSLVSATGETAHLGILRAGEVLSVCGVESPRTLRTPSTVGRRTPAHASSLGKAILAFRPEEELDLVAAAQGFPRYTRATLGDLESLRRDLERVRRCGYALDNEEYEEGLKCVGAPVRDASGEVVAAVSIAGPAKRLNSAELPRLIREVLQTALELSGDLGGGEGWESSPTGRIDRAAPANGPARPIANQGGFREVESGSEGEGKRSAFSHVKRTAKSSP